MARVRFAPPAVFLLLLSAACESVYVFGTTIPDAQRLSGAELVGRWTFVDDDNNGCFEMRQDSSTALILAGVSDKGDSIHVGAQLGRIANRLILELTPPYEGWPIPSLLLELEHRGDTLRYRELSVDDAHEQLRRLGLERFGLSVPQRTGMIPDNVDLILAGPPDELARIVEATLLADSIPASWTSTARVASCPAREG